MFIEIQESKLKETQKEISLPFVIYANTVGLLSEVP